MRRFLAPGWAVPILLILGVGMAACEPLWPPATPTPLHPTPAPSPTPWLGRPYLGLYGVFPEDIPRVATTSIQVIAVPPDSQERMRAYLDLAWAHGLRVRVSLSPSFLVADPADVTAYISALADHPGVAMWYLPEEPKTSADRARWKRLYEVVRQADPAGRPVGLYLAGGATVDYFREWLDVTDILMTGAYPDYYGIPRAALFTRVHNAAIAAAEQGKGVIAVPQFFDLADIRAVSPDAVEQNRPLQEGYPSPGAFRADAYTALIAGAQGIDWYSLEYAKGAPGLWESMTATAQELAEVMGRISEGGTEELSLTEEVVAGPRQVESFRGMYEDACVFRGFIKEGEDITILAVNLADEDVAVQFRELPSDCAEAHVFAEERTLDMENGTLSDVFAPHQAHVYILPGCGKGIQE